jgi:ferredoxin
MKKKQTILLSALMVSSAVFAIYKVKDVLVMKNQNTSDKTVINQILSQELTVVPNKCIGCGKCVKIDPNHFKFDLVNRVAVVISKDNLKSSALSLAINNCPAGAISLI